MPVDAQHGRSQRRSARISAGALRGTFSVGDQLTPYQIDISDDGFLSLMKDSGETKDDVKLPEGELGDKIKRLFEEGKDPSESSCWH